MPPKRFGIIFACISFGIVIGWLLPFTSPFTSEKILSYRGAVLRQDSGSYKFISPLLACDIGSEDAFPEFAPLKKILTDLVAEKVAMGDAQNISIYLRSMYGARWLEIHGDQTYAPASLLKIFVMMAYYKEANETDNPGLLQQQIPFMGSALFGKNDTSDAVGGAITHFINGKLYTIDQIIKQMIIYSDNDAYATLLANLDSQTEDRLKTIFTDIDIPLPSTQSEESLDFMSVNKYSMVFRVLFGSTYLSERYSEKALQLLSEAKYTTGIVAGVPQNINIAHKYGIRAVPSVSTTNLDELHDCGIVYYPSHPYLLCIMTSGRNLITQQNAIKDISATTYTWLESFYKTLAPSNATTSAPSVVTP